jgi:S-DNA-T family DNA segregation ATPase FtsK/SpoIIIE
MDRNGRIKDEIVGVLSVLLGLVVIISLISANRWDQSLNSSGTELNNLLGSFGSILSDIMLQAIGYASYLFPLILFAFGFRKITGREFKQGKIVFATSFIFLVISASSLFTLAFGGHSGGVVGINTTDITVKIFSTFGSYLLFASLTLISLMYLIPFSLIELTQGIRNRAVLGSRAIAAMKSQKKSKKEPRIKGSVRTEIEPEPEFHQEPLPLAFPEVKSKPLRRKSGDYELPDMELLQDPPPSKSRPTKEELIDRSDLLESKLRDYAIEGKVTYVSPGPIVTMFEFEPAPGVKISKVISLADDLSMALKASSIRISPIHGRSTLGIEVPNKDRDDVFLKDIIANDAFMKSHSKLTLALGKDIFGIPVMADLIKMPHLLIAGATGSGKSVGMNSIVLSLLYRATPSEVKMLMIDPKMLELSAYEEIPHLLMPVITLPKEASNALKKLVFEM